MPQIQPASSLILIKFFVFLENQLETIRRKNYWFSDCQATSVEAKYFLIMLYSSMVSSIVSRMLDNIECLESVCGYQINDEGILSITQWIWIILNMLSLNLIVSQWLQRNLDNNLGDVRPAESSNVGHCGSSPVLQLHCGLNFAKLGYFIALSRYVA
ncbi:hypothetical protein C8R44DRAFT_734809 [Mycena epipterygia]|nr:hypothetical protein C8R44DRAFT_734809 [Mycena epipterygia]